MRITRLETFLTHAGLRNYLFLRLTTDTGLTGIGEASLEWQERAVECLLHDWVQEQIIGADPRDVASLATNMIRDQYQGGSTVLTAISGVEIACWDLIGKASGQPVYELLGGRARERLPAYANGWYGGAITPADYAEKARAVVARGYRAMKFDPFGVAWKEMTEAEMTAAEQIVAAVRDAVGDEVELMIEVHGRLSVECAIEMGRRLAPYRPAWYEEPVSPWDLDSLVPVKNALPFPIAAGERCYMLEEFDRLTSLGSCDIVQPDLAHCGGLSIGKKIAAMAQARGQRIAPHCSIGPVALCAALHFGWATPNVCSRRTSPITTFLGETITSTAGTPVTTASTPCPPAPASASNSTTAVCAAHPYQKNPFPSLWDDRWLKEFTKAETKTVGSGQ